MESIKEIKTINNRATVVEFLYWEDHEWNQLPEAAKEMICRNVDPFRGGWNMSTIYHNEPTTMPEEKK